MGVGTVILIVVSGVTVAVLTCVLVAHFFPSIGQKMEESNRKSREEAVRLGKEREALAAEERRQRFAEERSGNHSFLPMYIGGEPTNHAGKILDRFEQFEKENPSLEIIGWTVEEVQMTHGVGYGLWVDHRPKKRKKRGGYDGKNS